MSCFCSCSQVCYSPLVRLCRQHCLSLPQHPGPHRRTQQPHQRPLLPCLPQPSQRNPSNFQATSCRKPAKTPPRCSTVWGGIPAPPNSDFTCVDVTVPLDHTQPPAQPQDGGTIKVVFGVLPASGERKGMFVTATGGPGTSGLLSADSYTSAFDPSIPEHFDIVFFDQRGVGLSGGLQCA